MLFHANIREKMCVRKNYIPRQINKFSIYEEWKFEHFSFILGLYDRFSSVIDNRHISDVNWDSSKIFEMFCRFIYSQSSKQY